MLEEGDHVAKVMLTLNPHPGFKDSWCEFKINSLADTAWTEHCHGLIRIEEDIVQGI
jgi:hypothetical protein